MNHTENIQTMRSYRHVLEDIYDPLSFTPTTPPPRHRSPTPVVRSRPVTVPGAAEGRGSRLETTYNPRPTFMEPLVFHNSMRHRLGRDDSDECMECHRCRSCRTEGERPGREGEVPTPRRRARRREVGSRRAAEQLEGVSPFAVRSIPIMTPPPSPPSLDDSYMGGGPWSVSDPHRVLNYDIWERTVLE